MIIINSFKIFLIFIKTEIEIIYIINIREWEFYFRHKIKRNSKFFREDLIINLIIKKLIIIDRFIRNF